MLSLSPSPSRSLPRRSQAPPRRRSRIEVPTRTDLSLLEQEWYLLQASLASAEQAQRLWWAVALCWERYVAGRIASTFSDVRPELKADLQQSGLTGAYHSARRYRLEGCWSACVMMGVRDALATEMHRSHSGCWIGRPSRQRLTRIGKLRAKHPDWSLRQVAAHLGLSIDDVHVLVSAARRPMRLRGIEYDTDTSAEHSLRSPSPDEDELCELLEDSRRLSRLRAALPALPQPARGLLVDHWGLAGAPRVSVCVLARRYRMSPHEVRDYLARTQAHLHAILRGQQAPCTSQPMTEHTIQRLVYERYAGSYLTWAEVVTDFELASIREARHAARRHALRSNLPLLTNDDRYRLDTPTLVRNEDCYQLAAEGYTWAEVAGLADVASGAAACRHARTFAYRSRSGSPP